jgi:hypothetical protein
MNTTTQLDLHYQAISLVKKVNDANEAVKRLQDSAVEIQYNTFLTEANKRMFIAQSHEMIADWRNMKRQYIEQYARLLQQLVEPAMPNDVYITTHEIVSI